MKSCTCTLACQGLASLDAEGVDIEELYCKAQGIDPAATRECDGYPGLAAPAEAAAECCGDPGDCGTCGG